MRSFLLLLLFALAVRAQEVPPQYNFLLIVDSSISMAERKAPALSAVRDLVRTSFSGQIEADDTIDLWTFDSHGGGGGESFPTQIWNPARGGTIAVNTTEFVRMTKFHRGNRLSPLIDELAKLVPNTKALFVALITDGEEQISGISLDLEINTEIAKLRREAMRGKRPIVVTMIAVDGNLLDWTAFIAGSTPSVAKLPERPKPEPKLAAVTEVAPEEVKPMEPEAPPTPRVFNYPPGARLLFNTPEPPQQKIPAIAVHNDAGMEKIPVFEPPVVEPITQAPIPTKNTHTIIAPSTTQGLVAAGTPPPAPDPPNVQMNAPAHLVVIPAEPHSKLPSNSEAIVKLNLGTNNAAEKPALVEPVGLPFYALAGAGAVCLAITGFLMFRRSGQMPKQSLISSSLAK